MSRVHNNTVVAELRELMQMLVASDVPELADLRRVERLRVRNEHQDNPGDGG